MNGREGYDALGDSMPPDLRVKVGEMRKDMELCKSVLRQHLEDSAHTNSQVSSYCLNHCLNSTKGFKSCSHDPAGCEMCVKLFPALALVDYLITKVQDNRRQKIFIREHELLLRSVVLLWVMLCVQLFKVPCRMQHWSLCQMVHACWWRTGQ